MAKIRSAGGAAKRNEQRQKQSAIKAAFFRPKKSFKFKYIFGTIPLCSQRGKESNARERVLIVSRIKVGTTRGEGL